MGALWAGLTLILGILLVPLFGSPIGFFLPAVVFVPIAGGVVLGLTLHLLSRLLR